MFGLSLSEILIIAMIALVVLGPEKFPEFAKIALRAFRDLRGYVDDIKREMAEELNPVKNELTKLAQFNAEDYVAPITEALSGIESDLNAEIKKTVDAVTNETTTDAPAKSAESPSVDDPYASADADASAGSPASAGVYEEASKTVSSEPTEDVGSFSEGKRFPEPTPGGESSKDSERYPD